MAEPLELALSLSFAGAAARARLEPLYALDAEIAAIARPGVEHAVAHAKLAWWRGEADRLAALKPEHPLARALLAAAGDAPRYGLLHERLAAAEFALVGFAPATVPELEALVARSHGALQALAAQALAGRADDALAEFGLALGGALGILSALATPGGPLAAALPRDELLARARAALAATTALPRALRAAQTHGYVRASLAAARLARLEAQRARAEPPPLSQLWRAWRAARRARLE